MLAIVVNLIILYRKGRQRNGLAPFWLSLVGGLLVIGPGYLLSNQVVSIVGVVFILMGALLNSLPYKKWLEWTHSIYSIFKGVEKRFLLLRTKRISNYKKN